MNNGKIEKNNFLLQNDQFCSKGVEIFKKHVVNISYTGKLPLAKVKKVLLLQRNDEKVTFLLIYHLSGF